MTTIASTGPASRAGIASSVSPMDPNRLKPCDTFIHRHIGPCENEVAQMLALVGYDSLDALTDAVVPASIRLSAPLPLEGERGENELLNELRAIAQQNRVMRSCIGMGYSDCITPPVIQRNVLENPGWYTQYTPYQAEIAQGRLEALLNFQTMIADLTGLPAANASLLDEGTAAAEAMAMCHAIAPDKPTFFIADDCHPQTINVVKTRAASMGIQIQVGNISTLINDKAQGLLSLGVCGLLVQYPATDGVIHDPASLAKLADKIHEAGGLFVVAADPLALTLLKAPGEFGADICVGSAQRFGVPMGCGGPHAAFMATKQELIRKMPGRIVGVSKDAQGNPAYRLAIQTREQHIRREKATSNICTAQVLLAVMASMYAVYHGPDGLRRIARRVSGLTGALAAGVTALGHEAGDQPYFDTLKVGVRSLRGRITPVEAANQVYSAAQARGYNLRRYEDGALGVSFDETTTLDDVAILLEAFALGERKAFDVAALATEADTGLDDFQRRSPILTHPVFNTHRSEHEMLRYLRKLESRDLSLTTSMIPLGSCTMKLNGTSEMIPVTWPEFGRIHPFAPAEQLRGYEKLCGDLEAWLCAITGFAAVSLQPNAGSQGEYAGLLAIRAYHESRAQGHRNICLIPVSAHGTNPASAVIAGFEVVVVACDKYGNVDADDLRKKAQQHAANLACLMITYPSTHGVFEPNVKEIVGVVHEHGGQVYMDGANMNAQVGLTSPASIGADVCHLNLHKTFCIPHGGGGPGMGPIGVAEHLKPFLPGSPLGEGQGPGARGQGVGPVSAAPWGSASILPISYVYIALMGGMGLKRATQVAILSANYMAKRLSEFYPVVYTGTTGLVAHEFIIDCRQFEATSGVKIDDIAKRLMDYGFHAPTMSFPVPGTLMIEPTESEPKPELDRLCDALIAIRQEIRDIEEGKADRHDNALKHAPHTARAVTSDAWSHKYSREQAAYPAPWLKEHKFWPHVGRIDNPYGDRNLFCTCPPLEA